MSIFHHPHHSVPFESDAGFPDPIGDRRDLKVEIGRLRRLLHERDDRIAQLEAENARLLAERDKRWWKL